MQSAQERKTVQNLIGDNDAFLERVNEYWQKNDVEINTENASIQSKNQILSEMLTGESNYLLVPLMDAGVRDAYYNLIYTLNKDIYLKI